MKALAKLKPDVGIWMTDVDEPHCGHNDVLIKTIKTAICGTDVHIYNWDDWAQETIATPLVIGHEFVGEIVDIGCEVHGIKVGDRVSGEGHITCGMCRNCRAGERHLCRSTIGLGVQRPGCFAEYLTLPAKNVFLLPDEISDDIASFLDPLGNACHCTSSFDLVGEDVLITGAGPIGCMAVAIARHSGARNVVITDVNDYRLSLAKQMGATRIVNIERQSLLEVMQELGIKEGFEVGLEMSGSNDALQQLISRVNHGGSIALLGIPTAKTPINWTDIIFKGMTIKGIYGREVFETWYKMKNMLQSGLDVSPVLTHHFSIDDFQQGFDVMKSGQCGKVVLDWR